MNTDEFNLQRFLKSIGFTGYTSGSDMIFYRDRTVVTLSFQSQSPNTKERPNHVMIVKDYEHIRPTPDLTLKDYETFFRSLS